MRLLILHDDVGASDRPDEADTMAQVRSAAEACAALRHDAASLGVTLRLDRLHEALRARRPEVVFNLVESLNSRGSLIHLAPAVVEANQIPMTGSPALAIHTTSSKIAAKKALRAVGLPTAPWMTPEDEDAETTFPPGPWIIKSVWEHASIGLDERSVIEATSPDALREAIESRRSALGGEAFAEAFIDGREFNLSILDIDGAPVVLPEAEIDFVGFAPDAPRLVGYRAKWDEHSAEYHNTVRRFDFPAKDRALLRELRRLAEACWRLFGLRGYARVDFRVTPENQPLILEVNVNPCLSPDAGFMAAAERAELGPVDVIERILDAARRPTAFAR